MSKCVEDNKNVYFRSRNFFNKCPTPLAASFSKIKFVCNSKIFHKVAEKYIFNESLLLLKKYISLIKYSRNKAKIDRRFR